jgi:hypothetical protein
MRHVISASEAETGRQPPGYMNPPVDFFGRDQVDSPANEVARGDPET